jgi:hypothetical protein
LPERPKGCDKVTILGVIQEGVVEFPHPWTPEVLFQVKFDQQIRVVATKGGMVFTPLDVVLENSGGPNHINPGSELPGPMSPGVGRLTWM